MEIVETWRFQILVSFGGKGVLTTIITNDDDLLKPSSILLLAVPRCLFFCGPVLLLMFSLCCLVCFLQPCDQLLGKGPLLSCM